VRLTHDGAHGVDAAIEYRPDAILLDIGLPDVDGYEVARRLRALPELAGVRLIAVSGFGAETASGQDRTIFDRYLTKPVSREALEGVLAQVRG
jgi:two-component system CheB/CheR fusion protein